MVPFLTIVCSAARGGNLDWLHQPLPPSLFGIHHGGRLASWPAAGGSALRIAMSAGASAFFHAALGRSCVWRVAERAGEPCAGRRLRFIDPARGDASAFEGAARWRKVCSGRWPPKVDCSFER